MAVIYGTSEADVMSGSEGNDELFGLESDDQIWGLPEPICWMVARVLILWIIESCLRASASISAKGLPASRRQMVPSTRWLPSKSGRQLPR